MNDIKSYATVQKWIANVNRYYQLTDAEWEERLAALRTFCERVGSDPDTLIEEARENKERKVDLMRTLRKIAHQAAAGAQAAHDWDNIVRSFFIHNGARVVVRAYEE